MATRSWNRRDFSRLALGLGACTVVPPRLTQAAEARDYQFNKSISRPVLENYLSRAITVQDLFIGQGNFDDNLRMLTSVGAKFLGRTLCFWADESHLLEKLEKVRTLIPKAHAAEPEMVAQACIFEIITPQVEQVPVPAWAFEMMGMPVETRNFRFADMSFADGRFRNHWGRGGGTVPDVSRPETQLYFQFLAASYIDAGVEAIHYGQVELMNKNDRDLAHYAKVLERARAYAAKKARRGMLLCDAHVPSGGFLRDGKLLLDFHSFPLRIKEIPDPPLGGILEMGHSDGLYGRSKGGTTYSGWSCDHLPYLAELDNFGRGRNPGQFGQGGIWSWGYDEISWFAHLPADRRAEWLKYAWSWTREHDPAAFLQMPGGRVLHAPVDGKRWYYANNPSPAVPDGFGDESAIKAVWAADTATR